MQKNLLALFTSDAPPWACISFLMLFIQDACPIFLQFYEDESRYFCEDLNLGKGSLKREMNIFGAGKMRPLFKRSWVTFYTSAISIKNSFRLKDLIFPLIPHKSGSGYYWEDHIATHLGNFLKKKSKALKKASFFTCLKNWFFRISKTHLGYLYETNSKMAKNVVIVFNERKPNYLAPFRIYHYFS